jgi:transcriptional regulator with XRE-family HTH domain
LRLLIENFAPSGPVVLGRDDTIERRRGKRIAANGIYRDQGRSGHGHFVKASGLRWLSAMRLVPIPWAERLWALPCSDRACPLRTTQPRARQATQKADRAGQTGDPASTQMAAWTRPGAGCRQQRRRPGFPGRSCLPRRSGGCWCVTRLAGSTRKPFCTDPNQDPHQVLRWFVQRWQLETTFQETRAHPGVETQRQWSDLAITRTTPSTRVILPRNPARRTVQPEGTRGRYERGLVSQTPPYLQRYTCRCPAVFLVGRGFCHVSPFRRGEETLPSTPARHHLYALPRCLMAKVKLREARLHARITQREVARAIGVEYFQTIGANENGRARVPPARYADYARVLKMDPKDFVRKLLRHYDPEAWKILFRGNNIISIDMAQIEASDHQKEGK